MSKKYKYGFINKQGQIAIEARFDDAKDFHNGLAAVKLGEKWGYIDKTGQFVTERLYDWVPEKLDEDLNRVQIRTKWGYVNKTGKVIIQPQFDKAFPFSEGLAAVYFDEGWGYINTAGKFYIWGFDAPKFPEGTGIEFRKFRVEGLGRFSDGWATIEAWMQVVRENKVLYSGQFMGYIDKRGDYVFPPLYKEGLPIHKDLIIVKTAREDQVERFCIFDRNVLSKGSSQMPYRIPPIFEKVDRPVEDFFRVTVTKQELAIDFDLENRVRVNLENNAFHSSINSSDICFAIYLSAIGRFRNPTKFPYVRVHRGHEPLYNFIDDSGKLVSHLWFEGAFEFSEGVAVVKVNGKWGAIDKLGDFVIKPQHEFLSSFHQNRAAFLKDGKMGFIDKSGAVVIPPTYLKVDNFSEGLAPVAVGNGLFGYIDLNGEMVIQPEVWLGYFAFHDGLAQYCSLE
ncbi:MAG: WG repeat-containing protein [Promethearchaeota archaeon]